jgi:DNA-binding CsgD family transcriptional regulator
MGKSGLIDVEPASLHLDDLAVCVYQYAAVRHRFHLADVATHCGVTDIAAQDAISRLVTFRLLETVQDDRGEPTGEYAAVPPGTAAVHLLGPGERQMRNLQRELEHKRVMLDSLVPVYEASSVRRRLPGAVEPLTDVDTVRSVLIELAATCKYEVLTAHPGGGRDGEVLNEAALRDHQMLRRGIRMRTLYQQSARFHQATAAYVESVAALGAQVRTVSGGLMRMIAFDREHLIIPLRDGSDGAALVRDASCIDLAVTAFDLLWPAARPFAANSGRDELRVLSDDTKKSLLRLLVGGATDQAAARRLGISVRTCQRHIAEIMDRLDARNRLQLGFLIQQHGLLADTSHLAQPVPAA